MSSILSNVKGFGFLECWFVTFVIFFSVCRLGPLWSMSGSLDFPGFLLLPSDSVDSVLLVPVLFVFGSLISSFPGSGNSGVFFVGGSVSLFVFVSVCRSVSDI